MEEFKFAHAVIFDSKETSVTKFPMAYIHGADLVISFDRQRKKYRFIKDIFGLSWETQEKIAKYYLRPAMIRVFERCKEEGSNFGSSFCNKENAYEKIYINKDMTFTDLNLYDFDPEKSYNYIKFYLIEYFKHYNLKSAVIGLSGGIDSTVSALILSEVCYELGIPLIGRCLTIDSKYSEIRRANLIGECLCDDYIETNVLEGSFKLLNKSLIQNTNKIRNGNLKARLRMIALYDLAKAKNGIVIDNENTTEFHLGFSTLHGDVGDIKPLKMLWKSDIYLLADYILENKVKTSKLKNALIDVINAEPTDGLGISSSDMEQIGAPNYRIVDDILYHDFWDDMDEIDIIDKYGETIVNNIMRKKDATKYKRERPNIEGIDLITVF